MLFHVFFFVKASAHLFSDHRLPEDQPIWEQFVYVYNSGNYSNYASWSIYL